MITEFKSIFSPELDSYIAHRKACGYLKKSLNIPTLRRLDDFISQEYQTKGFTRDNAEKWIIKRAKESSIMHYQRVNASKHFFQFLFPQGYKVFLFYDVKNPPRSFIPHIYSNDEITRYFQVVDNYRSCN